jgi:hypothetical protein
VRASDLPGIDQVLQAAVFHSLLDRAKLVPAQT